MATNQSNIDILIKRRLDRQGASADAPGTNALKSGELAMNEVDKTVYYGLSTVSGISAIPIAGAGFLSKTTANVTGTVTGNIEGGTATTQALTSDILLGGYNAGEEIPAGTTLAQFITGLLYREYQPDITAPSGSFSASAGGTVEVGETANVTLTYTLNRGVIKGSVQGTWDSTHVQGPRSGEATGYKFDSGSGYGSSQSENQLVVSNVYFNGSKTFKGNVSFGAGPMPLTSKGNNATVGILAAATDVFEGIASIDPQRKSFWAIGSGTAPSYANSDAVRGLGNSQFGLPASLPYTSTSNHVVLAIPANKSLSKVVDNALNYDITGRFELKGTVNVAGATANQDETSYKVYVYYNQGTAPATVLTLTYV